MRLDQLTLTNFRGFESLDITFDPEVTVLLGANMSGKTAVLDAAAIALSEYFAGFSLGLRSREPERDIDESDVRKVVHVINGIPDLQRQRPTLIAGRASAGQRVWSWERGGEATFSTLSKFGAKRAARVQRGDDVDLVLLAAYATTRLWRGEPGRLDDSMRLGSRLDGYAGCLVGGASQAQLVGWLKKQTLVELQRGRGYKQPQLAAVLGAVRSCVGDVNRLWYDVEFDEIRLERRGGNLQSFSMLSDGYRNMLALVADLAWRAAVLNPQFGPDAHALSDGVVLIDEVELHLHPSWQRRVLDDLRRTFPKVQFIVTTHSPQVVASVKRSQVRLLHENKLLSADLFVEGRDTSELLEDVFGVPARPESTKRELEYLHDLIDSGQFEAARKKLEELEQHLGPYDQQLVRARWILDTEAADEPTRAAAP